MLNIPLVVPIANITKTTVVAQRNAMVLLDLVNANY